MIAKRIDIREASKSRATRLAEYVTSELGKTGRVADSFTVNCRSDDPLIAAKEMEICQARNTRSKDDKTYHLLMSFPDGERPDAHRLREIAAAAAKELGYTEHQRIVAVYDDTDNLHMHIIVNKIHPQRHTIHTPRHDFKVLGELCQHLEATLALQSTNHEAAKTYSESKIQDLEKHSGLESFMNYARERAIGALSAAKSWREAHRSLAAVGIAVQIRGNGMVLVDQGGGIAIKASSIGREFSKAKLEKRLGAFVSPVMAQTEVPATATVNTVRYLQTQIASSPSLYQQYLTAKQTASESRKAELASLWDKQQKITRAILDAGKVKFSAAAGHHSNRRRRKQVNDAVKAKLVQVHRNMVKSRAVIKSRYKTAGFIDWLKQEAEQGNVPAIYALRKRGAVAPALINITASDLRDAKLIASKITHVTSRGTLFYKSGADIFRDNGNHLSLKKDISDEGVKAALMIAMAKFGGQLLTVNGTEEFKERCIEVATKFNLPLVFTDAHMEEKRLKRISSPSSQHPNTERLKGKMQTNIANRDIHVFDLKNTPERGMCR